MSMKNCRYTDGTLHALWKRNVLQSVSMPSCGCRLSDLQTLFHGKPERGVQRKIGIEFQIEFQVPSITDFIFDFNTGQAPLLQTIMDEQSVLCRKSHSMLYLSRMYREPSRSSVSLRNTPPADLCRSDRVPGRMLCVHCPSKPHGDALPCVCTTR